MTVREIFTRMGLKVDESSFRRGDRALAGVKRAAFAAASAIGVTLGARAFGQMISGTVAAGDRLDKFTAATGIAASTVQELAHAAELNGVAASTMESALQRATRRLAQASEGHGAAKRVVEQYGISLRDSSGRLRDQEDLLEDVSRAMRGAESQAERLAIANAVFGREGENVVRVFQQGADALAAQRAEARALGGVMSEELIAKSAELRDNQQRLQMVLGGVKHALAEAIVPAMNATAEAALEWVRANGDLMRQRVAQWTRDLLGVVDGARRVVVGIVRAFGAWFDVLNRLEPRIGATSVRLLQMLTVFGAIAAVVGLTKALLWAKIALLALVIAFVASAISDWKNFAAAVDDLVRTFNEADIKRDDNPILWLIQQISQELTAAGGLLDSFIADLQTPHVPFLTAVENAVGRIVDLLVRASDLIRSVPLLGRVFDYRALYEASRDQAQRRGERRRAGRDGTEGLGPAALAQLEEAGGWEGVRRQRAQHQASLHSDFPAAVEGGFGGLDTRHIVDNRRTEFHVDARGATDPEGVREAVRQVVREYDAEQRRELHRDLVPAGATP